MGRDINEWEVGVGSKSSPAAWNLDGKMEKVHFGLCKSYVVEQKGRRSLGP